MNYWPAITVSLVFVIIAVLTNDGFEQRWCATYPDWCMPVSADDSDLFVDWYDDV